MWLNEIHPTIYSHGLKFYNETDGYILGRKNRTSIAGLTQNQTKLIQVFQMMMSYCFPVPPLSYLSYFILLLFSLSTPPPHQHNLHLPLVNLLLYVMYNISVGDSRTFWNWALSPSFHISLFPHSFLILLLFFFFFFPRPCPWIWTPIFALRGTLELQRGPMPPPQHPASVIYTAAYGNARSWTHWVRPGIEPTSSQRQCWILSPWSHNGNSSLIILKKYNQRMKRPYLPDSIVYHLKRLSGL